MRAKKSGLSWVYRLTAGCKNNSENWATDSGEPQLHKEKLDHRRYCTVKQGCSAGSPFGTCVAVQVAFVAAALNETTLVLPRFWVTVCSKINDFWPNQRLSVKYTLEDD